MSNMRHTGAALLFVVMAVAHSWPLARDPLHLTRLDNDDAALNTWVIAWVAHILPRDPIRMFEAPIFHPAPHALAYSEHLLVPSLLGAPLLWSGASPVLVHNLLIIAGLALSAWAMYLVMFRWTSHAGAAAIAGLLYAFNAHTLTRFVHLQAFHVWLFPVMLYAFDRVLTGGTRRDVALLVAAFTGQALCSNYLLVFSTGALIVAALVRADEWLPASRGQARLQLGIAAALSVAVLAPFLYPYYALSQANVLPTHGYAEMTHYSASWRDYLATGGRLHFELWSKRFYTDLALFPGITALVLAAYAVITHGAWRDRRVRMVMALTVAGLAVSFGTHLPGYWWVHQHVPLVGSLRNVGRWGFLPLAGVAVLAGIGAKGAIGANGAKGRVLVLIALVTIEAWRAPIGLTHYDGIPRYYERFAAETDVVVAEFPFYAGVAWNQNGRYLLHNTRYFKPLVNGYSSYWPPPWEPRARVLEGFPSREAVAELMAAGVTRVVVHRDAFAQRHGEARLGAIDAVPELVLVDDNDGIRLYRLK